MWGEFGTLPVNPTLVTAFLNGFHVPVFNGFSVGKSRGSRKRIEVEWKIGLG